MPAESLCVSDEAVHTLTQLLLLKGTPNSSHTLAVLIIALSIAPLLDASKTSYLPFESLYGKEPSGNNLPLSTPPSDRSSTRGQYRHKTLLKNTNVRKVIFCGECLNPCYIYSAARLSRAKETIVERVIESKMYMLVGQPSSLQLNLSMTQSLCYRTIVMQILSKQPTIQFCTC